MLFYINKSDNNVLLKAIKSACSYLLINKTIAVSCRNNYFITISYILDYFQCIIAIT